MVYCRARGDQRHRVHRDLRGNAGTEYERLHARTLEPAVSRDVRKRGAQFVLWTTLIQRGSVFDQGVRHHGKAECAIPCRIVQCIQPREPGPTCSDGGCLQRRADYQHRDAFANEAMAVRFASELLRFRCRAASITVAAPRALAMSRQPRFASDSWWNSSGLQLYEPAAPKQSCQRRS